MLPNNNILNFSTFDIESEDIDNVNDLLTQFGRYPFLCSNEILYKFGIDRRTQTPQLTQIGFACEVVNQIEMLGTDEKFVRFAYIKNSVEQELVLPRSVLGTRQVSTLLDAGYSFNPEADRDLCRYLMVSEQHAKLQYQHKFVGLFDFDGKLCFALKDIVGSIHSEYVGHIDLAPTGTFEAWLDCIKQDIVGRSGLEFGFCAGLAAPLINVLDDINQGNCLFVNFCGSSSIGKSTTLVVAESAFGNPSIKEGKLLNTWKATDNALPALLRDNTGVPISFDEYGLRDKKTDIDFIYLLTQGREKERMNKDASLKPTISFCTSILSTGEISILASAKKQNDGQLVRLVEINSGFDYTDSAEHADRIKNVLLNNYGHAARRYIKYLLEHKDELCDEYNKISDDLCSILSTQDKLKERLAKQYSFVLLAAQTANKVFGLTIDVQRLSELSAVSINEGLTQKSELERAVDYLEQYAVVNKDRFPDTPCSYGTVFGTLKPKGGYLELAVITKEFDRILKEAGFDEPAKIVKQLKEADKLDCEKGKNYRRRRFGSQIEAPAYIIKLCKTAEEPAEPRKPKPLGNIIPDDGVADDNKSSEDIDLTEIDFDK